MAEPTEAAPSVAATTEDEEFKVVTATCCHCGKMLKGNKNMRRCGKCELAGFCDLECLRAGWKKHSKLCNPAAARRVIAESLQDKKTSSPAAAADQPAATSTSPSAPPAAGDAKPLMPAGGKATVTTTGGEMSVKEKARLQAMAGSGRGADIHRVSGLKGETLTITQEGTLGGSLTKTLVFDACEACDIVLGATCTKIFLQGCDHCKLRIAAPGKVVSGVIEVYKSKHVSIVMETSVLTFQADASEDLDLTWTAADCFRMIIWAGCNNLVARVPDVVPGAAALECRTGMAEMASEWANLRADIDQFKISLHAGKLINEKVVRLNNGFPTTQREQVEFDTRQEANLQKLASQMGITIKPKKKTELDKCGRNDLCPCGSGKKYKNCCSK